MKLIFRSAKKNFVLLLPTGLLLNRPVVSVAARIVSRVRPEFAVSPKDCRRLICCLKKYKHRHKRLELVDIHTADGKQILIRL